MQEKYALRKALKGVAALGTGVAMLGMTLSGALAADLGSFPGAYSGAKFVVGSGAAGSDTSAANMIAGLDAFRTGTSAPGSTVLTEGGDTKDIPLGKNVVSTLWDGFDTILDDSDLEVLQDGEVNFQNTNYDYREYLAFSENSNVSVVTSIVAARDAYETVPRLHVADSSMYYIVGWDEAINVSKATSDNPLTMNFLGKSFELRFTGDTSSVIDTNENTQFSAYVGNEFFLKEGETVTVDGKTMKLLSVASDGTVSVDVDGVVNTITQANTKTVNGLEISNNLGFYTSRTGSDSYAKLFVGGQDAAGTWKHGDRFYGGDSSCPSGGGDVWNDPDCWDWFIGNLTAKSATTVQNTPGQGVTVSGPYIGVVNDFDINDEDDNPPIPGGECINFPNNFASICFDSVSESEDSYMGLSIKVKDSESFSSVQDTSGNTLSGFGTQSAERALVFESDDPEGLELLSSGSNLTAGITSNTKTDKIWISANSSTAAPVANNFAYDVFYRDSNGQIRYAGWISNMSNLLGGSAKTLFRVNYGDTKASNVQFNISQIHTTRMNITMMVEGKNTNDLVTSGDDLTFVFGLNDNSNETVSVGGSEDTAESETNVITWSTDKTLFRDLSAKEEDLLGLYGWILKNPKDNNKNERIELLIPTEQVYGVVRVTARALQGTGGGEEGGSTAAAVMTDTEVTSVDGKVVAVGGPCVNSVAAMLLGVASSSCGTASGFEEGVGYVKSVKNYSDFATELAGNTEVSVRGGLDVASIEVSGAA